MCVLEGEYQPEGSASVDLTSIRRPLWPGRESEGGCCRREGQRGVGSARTGVSRTQLEI